MSYPTRNETTRTAHEIRAELIQANNALDALIGGLKGALKPDRTWKVSMDAVIAHRRELEAELERAK